MRNDPPPAPVVSGAESSGEDSRTSAFSSASNAHAFTLIEMLVVLAVVSVLVALIVPAFTQVNAARALSRAAYDITGQLEQARAYAKANSTYTWLGFFEEDPTKSTITEGTGRVVLSLVASKDATSLYSLDSLDPVQLPPVSLQQIGKLVRIENVGLTYLAANEIPAREKALDSDGNAVAVLKEYSVGTDEFKKRGQIVNHATFTYPLLVKTGDTAAYTFVKIIQFNPAGDATKIVTSPQRLMEIDLRPARGTLLDTTGKNCAAIQIAGIGGRVQIYQP